MRESYIEDLASHDGPDHALATREGAAKRWIGVHAGRLWSLEMVLDRGADAVEDVGRQYRGRRYREPSADPAGSENPLHACDLSMLRTGRSHDHPLVLMVGRVVRGRPRP
jgi:hypothetical protein